jgi:hypothetical protein
MELNLKKLKIDAKTEISAKDFKFPVDSFYPFTVGELIALLENSCEVEVLSDISLFKELFGGDFQFLKNCLKRNSRLKRDVGPIKLSNSNFEKIPHRTLKANTPIYLESEMNLFTVLSSFFLRI